MPVLYGVFLYMGVSSLKGIQVRLCVRPADGGVKARLTYRASVCPVAL